MISSSSRNTFKNLTKGGTNMFDLFIEQTQIADGTGKPIYTAKVGIKDGQKLEP